MNKLKTVDLLRDIIKIKEEEKKLKQEQIKDTNKSKSSLAKDIIEIMLTWNTDNFPFYVNENKEIIYCFDEIEKKSQRYFLKMETKKEKSNFTENKILEILEKISIDKDFIEKLDKSQIKFYLKKKFEESCKTERRTIKIVKNVPVSYKDVTREKYDKIVPLINDWNYDPPEKKNKPNEKKRKLSDIIKINNDVIENDNYDDYNDEHKLLIKILKKQKYIPCLYKKKGEEKLFKLSIKRHERSKQLNNGHIDEIVESIMDNINESFLDINMNELFLESYNKVRKKYLNVYYSIDVKEKKIENDDIINLDVDKNEKVLKMLENE